MKENFEEEFKDINENEEDNEEENPEVQKVGRVPLPKKGEVIGIIESRLGGNKMMVSCMDGKSRNCRVPGRLRRKLWLRPNDVVIIAPWELDNAKGDVLLKYKPNQIQWLRKNGHLEKEEMEF